MSLLINALKRKNDSIGEGSNNNSVGGRSGSRVKKLTVVAVILIVMAALAWMTVHVIEQKIKAKKIAEFREKLKSAAPALQDKLQEKISEKANDGETAGNEDVRKAQLEKMLQEKQADSSSSPVSKEKAAPQLKETLEKAREEAPASTIPGGDGVSRLKERPQQRKIEPSAEVTASSTSETTSASSSAPATVPPKVDTLKDKKVQPSENQSSSAQDTSSSSSSSADPSATNSDGIVEIAEKPTVDTSALNTARELIGQHKYKQAISLLDNKELSINTGGASSAVLGALYLQLGEVDQAQAYLEKVTNYNTNEQSKLIGLLGQSYFMQGKYQKAVDTLGRAAPDVYDDPNYYNLLGRAFLGLGQPESAVQVFQQVVANYPNNASYWLILALSYEQSGDLNSAIIAYKRAATLNTGNPHVTLFINERLSSLRIN